MEAFVRGRDQGYDSVRDVWLRSGLNTGDIERLAQADAFRSLGLDRREALWAVRALDRKSATEFLPLFDKPGLPLYDNEPETKLPAMPLGQHVIHDYQSLGLSLKAHPVSFMRPRLDQSGVVPNARLTAIPDGRRVSVSGLVLVRQRPGTGNAIFLTLEDEEAVANIIVWPRIFEHYRSIVLGSRFIRVSGRLQSESGVIHIVAERMEDLTSWLGVLTEEAHTILATNPCEEPPPPRQDSLSKTGTLSHLAGGFDPEKLRYLPNKDMHGSGRLKGNRTSTSNQPTREPSVLSPDHEELSQRAGAVMPKGRNFQ